MTTRVGGASLGPLRPAGARPAATAAGFAVPGPALGTVAAIPRASMLAVDPAVLGLPPELTADARRDRAGRSRGEAMLALLGRLQAGLLQEGDPAPTLQALAEHAADPSDAADPGLRAALAAIRLRARVELARRGLPDERPG